MKKKTVLRWFEIIIWICIGAIFGEIYMSIRLIPAFVDILFQLCI